MRGRKQVAAEMVAAQMGLTGVSADDARKQAGIAVIDAFADIFC